MRLTQFPALDCHAHIATDVTRLQLDALGDTVVFAVTRSLVEAEGIACSGDTRIVWGCGVHPGTSAALDEFNEGRFYDLLQRCMVIGEIGLDRRSGNLDKQRTVLRSILRIVADEPVLLSVHSRGCAGQILDILAEAPHPGTILHWFLADDAMVTRAIDLGCYFSVNQKMPQQMLLRIPLDRRLPETDYPIGAGRPGDIEVLEQMVAAITGQERGALRLRWYRNLRNITSISGAIDRLPDEVYRLILPA